MMYRNIMFHVFLAKLKLKSAGQLDIFKLLLSFVNLMMIDMKVTIFKTNFNECISVLQFTIRSNKTNYKT